MALTTMLQHRPKEHTNICRLCGLPVKWNGITWTHVFPSETLPEQGQRQPFPTNLHGDDTLRVVPE